MKTVGARLEFLEASYRAHIINMTELERTWSEIFLDALASLEFKL